MNFSNNLHISFRRLSSNKSNSLISIAGLVLGLGIVAVLLVFILNELGYNQAFANKDRIYRILNYNVNDNNTWANTPFVIGEAVKSRFAEVEDYTHQYNISDMTIKKDGEYIPEPKILSTDKSFFSIFGVELLQGSLDGFDQTANKVAISQQIAKKHFGLENPVGQLLTLKHNDKLYQMEVIALYKDIPLNSSIKGDLIVNSDFGIEHLNKIMVSSGIKPDNTQLKEAWEGVFYTNYIILKPGTSATALSSKIEDLGKEFSKKNNQLSFSLQPFTEVYFKSSGIIDNNLIEQGNITLLYVLGAVGLIILLVACINYLNLAAAQASTQTKDFAVRKVCGAPKSMLVGQMIGESLLISVIALPFALLLAHLAFPVFSTILGKSYTLAFNHQWLLSFGSLVIITLITGILSGLIVSLPLSTVKIVDVLKDKKLLSHNTFSLRKAMVVFQFVVFITLVSALILVEKQIHYAFTKDLGFIKEGLISVPLKNHNAKIFKQEISKNPDIISVSGTLWMPPSNNKMYISIPRVNNRDEMAKVNGLFVDYHFVETMGLKIIKGEDFDPEKHNSGVIVNESAIKALGLKEALGEQTAFGTVIGVVNDFNMFSLHEAITPMIIGLNPSMSQNLVIRVNTSRFKETIEFLDSSWEKTGATTPFEFEITDTILKDLYEKDIRFSRTVGLLALIAILISCLGLFGLSLFLSRQRTKEIGVRKVNGARTIEIMSLLNKEFIRWVVIAFVLATPVAWLVMHQWLETFSYKTELSWWIFTLAGLMALGIALLTVSWQSWKAARRNPVEAFRYE